MNDFYIRRKTMLLRSTTAVFDERECFQELNTSTFEGKQCFEKINIAAFDEKPCFQ